MLAGTKEKSFLENSLLTQQYVISCSPNPQAVHFLFTQPFTHLGFGLSKLFSLVPPPAINDRQVTKLWLASAGVKAPVTLYRITLERSDFYTRLGGCLHHATVIRYVPRSKNHHSNPVCAVPGKAKCKQQTRYTPVQYAKNIILFAEKKSLTNFTSNMVTWGDDMKHNGVV